MCSPRFVLFFHALRTNGYAMNAPDVLARSDSKPRRNESGVACSLIEQTAPLFRPDGKDPPRA